MIVGYLVNQYPKLSHSFIRREIAGLEAEGLKVIRYAIRSSPETLIDPADIAEKRKTRVLLEDVSLFQLAIIWLSTFFLQPVAWLNCLRLSFSMSRWSERPLWYHWAYFAEACVIRRWTKQDGITHLHTHFGTNGTEVAMFCQLLGGPTYSFTVHGPKEFDRPLMLSLMEKIRRAKFVVAVSSFGKSQLCRWCGHRHWDKIRVVHCGVDQSFLGATASPVAEVPTLVSVGRLVEQKGQLLLIEAARALKERGLDFELVLIGDGPLRPMLETLIERYRLSEQVILTGWATSREVREWMLRSRALVLPSFAEGLPVVIMESLALYRPAISTYIAGIPELIEDGISGWLIPSGSVSALTDAMEKVLQLPAEKLEAMGRAGACKVSQEFNADLEARKLANIFRELESNSQVRRPVVPDPVSPLAGVR